MGKLQNSYQFTHETNTKTMCFSCCLFFSPIFSLALSLHSHTFCVLLGTTKFQVNEKDAFSACTHMCARNSFGVTFRFYQPAQYVYVKPQALRLLCVRFPQWNLNELYLFGLLHCGRSVAMLCVSMYVTDHAFFHSFHFISLMNWLSSMHHFARILMKIHFFTLVPRPIQLYCIRITGVVISFSEFSIRFLAATKTNSTRTRERRNMRKN